MTEEGFKNSQSFPSHNDEDYDVQEDVIKPTNQLLDPLESNSILDIVLKRALKESTSHQRSAICDAESRNANQHVLLPPGLSLGGTVAPLKPPKPNARVHKESVKKDIASRARNDILRTPIPVVMYPEMSDNNPPPLSSFAQESGIILEGWLEKQSKSGLWLKRYFVLAESKTEYCMLRMYKKSYKCAWGEVGAQLKAAFPIVAFEKIESKIAIDPAASKREFFMVAGDVSPFHLNEHEETDSFHQMSPLADSRQLLLRAESGAGRLLWVTFLRRAREMALDAYD